MATNTYIAEKTVMLRFWESETNKQTDRQTDRERERERERVCVCMRWQRRELKALNTASTLYTIHNNMPRCTASPQKTQHRIALIHG